MSIPVLMEASYPVEVPDISVYQNYGPDYQPAQIDFPRVAANPGVMGVMVKASEGNWSGYPQAAALDQMNRAHDAGLHVIPYHYWHFEVPPGEQARRFKGVYSQAGFQPARFMLDIEDAGHDETRPPNRELTSAEIPAWTVKAVKVARAVRDALDAFSQVSGCAPLFYSGEWFVGWWMWLAGVGGLDMSWLNRYALHCASYTAPWMYLCTGFSMQQALFWQWTSTPPPARQLQGFPWPARLDMNYWLKSAAEFDAWISGGQIELPSAPPMQVAEAEQGIIRLANWLLRQQGHVLERLE